MSSRFICGCQAEIQSRSDVRDHLGYDTEGFVVCVAHTQRRRGWRDVPYRAQDKPHPDAAGWTPLQYESFLLFGEIPARALLDRTAR
jgi:hypothetical protein